MLYYLFFLIVSTFAIDEPQLRNSLFENYNKDSRPVNNINDTILLKYGLEINDLVYFNQKSENIELSMKNILSWEDNYLHWNITDNSPKYITAKLDKIWQPDLELYNAAAEPSVFDKDPIVKIYSNGTVEYIRYISYSFSCKLNLEQFPYDTQVCNMLFGSWKYPKKILDIRPFCNEKFMNFSVNPKFSHNEWIIDKISLTHDDYKYKCCPNDLWPNSVYTISLKRNPHKYNILVVMSICITLSSLCINLININIYYRTYILVFIPLTLIWLQIHVSSKIPVIENSTKLENIIMTCFFTTIISTFESGILYCILSKYSKQLLKFFKKDNKLIEVGYQYINEKPVCKYNENQNWNYKKIKKVIKNIDTIFRYVICFIFLTAIIIHLNL